MDIWGPVVLKEHLVGGQRPKAGVTGADWSRRTAEL